MFNLGKDYSRKEIAQELGGSEVSYLPMVDGKVVCGCFTYEDNPDLPGIILPGTRNDIEIAAKEFSNGYAVPIFIKFDSNKWKHVGHYRVVSVSLDPQIIEHHQVRSRRKRVGRDKVLMVLFLGPQGEHFDLATGTVQI
jgi:hypothetical protein